MCHSIIGGEYNCIITSKLVIQLTSEALFICVVCTNIIWYYKIATFKKAPWLVKRSSLYVTPPCTQPMLHTCIIYQHMHATYVSSDFVRNQLLISSNMFRIALNYRDTWWLLISKCPLTRLVKKAIHAIMVVKCVLEYAHQEDVNSVP